MAQPTFAYGGRGAYRRATIHSLPNELLSLIFTHTLLSDTEWRLLVDFHPTATFIARTCMLWRSITLHTPILWTQICHFWPNNIFQLYIQRSGVLPLTLYFAGTSSEPCSEYSREDCITLHTSRWKHIRARTQNLFFRDQYSIGQDENTGMFHKIPLHFIVEGHFPAAKSLTFLVERAFEPSDSTTQDPASSNLTFSAGIVPTYILPKLAEGAAKNFRCLSLLNMSFHLLREVPACFGTLPELEELELEGVNGQFEQKPDGTKVELAKLRTLKLRLQPRAAMMLLTAIETPMAAEMEYALLGGREYLDRRNTDNKWGGTERLLLGAKAQIATIKQVAFDAVELSASSDGIRVELSGSVHRLKLGLPRIAVSDIPTIVPLLPIPSSSSLVHVALCPPFSSDTLFVSSLVALLTLKDVRTVSLFAPTSTLHHVDTLEGVANVRKVRIFECRPGDCAALKERGNSKADEGRRLRVEIASLSEGIVST